MGEDVREYEYFNANDESSTGDDSTDDQTSISSNDSKEICTIHLKDLKIKSKCNQGIAVLR